MLCCLQTIRENRTWRHKWFKMDKPGRSLTTSRAPSEVGQDQQPPCPATAAATAPPVVPSNLESVQKEAEASSTPVVAVVQDVTASNALTCTEQEQRTEKMLKLLSSRLSELVSTVCPSSAADTENSATAALGQKVRQSLTDLAAVCRPKCLEVSQLLSMLMCTLDLRRLQQITHAFVW